MSIVSRTEIHPYSPEFRRRAAELRSSFFGGDVDRNERYLRWKYELNPAPESTALFMAVADDQLIGLRGIFGTRWRLGEGGVVAFPQSADSVVHHEYRGRGVYRAVDTAAREELAARGISHMISMSANATHRSLAPNLGWALLGDYEYSRRGASSLVLGPDKKGRAARYLRRTLNRRAVPIGQFRSFDRLTRRPPLQGSVRLSAVAEAGPMADVAARSAPRSPLSPVRDAPYMAWRFGNPLREYRFLYSGGESLDGYLVLCKASPWHVRIIDLEAADAGVAQGLLAAAVTALRFAALDIWMVSLPPDYVAALRQLGFVRLRPEDAPGVSDRVFMVRSITDGAASLEYQGLPLDEMGTWDMRMITSDAF